VSFNLVFVFIPRSTKLQYSCNSHDVNFYFNALGRGPPPPEFLKKKDPPKNQKIYTFTCPIAFEALQI
jgi:hypothetical protein